MAGQQVDDQSKDYSWFKLLCLFIGIGALVVASYYCSSTGYSLIPIVVVCLCGIILSLTKAILGGEWAVYIAFMNSMAIGLGGLIIAAAGLGILASPLLIYFSI